MSPMFYRAPAKKVVGNIRILAYDYRMAVPDVGNEREMHAHMQGPSKHIHDFYLRIRERIRALKVHRCRW